MYVIQAQYIVGHIIRNRSIVTIVEFKSDPYSFQQITLWYLKWSLSPNKDSQCDHKVISLTICYQQPHSIHWHNPIVSGLHLEGRGVKGSESRLPPPPPPPHPLELVNTAWGVRARLVRPSTPIFLTIKFCPLLKTFLNEPLRTHLLSLSDTPISPLVVPCKHLPHDKHDTSQLVVCGC